MQHCWSKCDVHFDNFPCTCSNKPNIQYKCKKGTATIFDANAAYIWKTLHLPLFKPNKATCMFVLVELILNTLKVSLCRNKSCFSISDMKYLVFTAFLPLLDDGGLLYMSATSQCLQSLDTVYHCASQFVTGYKHRTHHCTLYSASHWPLSIFLYMDTGVPIGEFYLKTLLGRLLGLVPTYLRTYLTRSQSHDSLLRPQHVLQ